MTEPRDDRSQARREAAVLLGVDIEHLSAADALRVDMVSALRLVIDSEQANVLAGSQADLGKLNVAVQSLIALLPGRELPQPERDDPHDPNDSRQRLWAMYSTMRERAASVGEGYDGKVRRVAELSAEVEQLRAELAQLKGEAPPASPLPMRLPDNVAVLSRPAPKDAPVAAPAALSTRVNNSPSPPAARPAWEDWVEDQLSGRGGGKWWGPV
jgi:hypothetical protein